MNRFTLITTVAAAVALMAVAAWSGRGAGAGPAPGGSSGGVPITDRDDRNLALGHFLDVPAAASSIDEGIAIAEKLRLRYGIDTGDRHADRVEAARRAKTELLDNLTFTEEDLEQAARRLGYSLNPVECADYCENVRRLAVATLQKRALKAFAEGEPVPAP